MTCLIWGVTYRPHTQYRIRYTCPHPSDPSAVRGSWSLERVACGSESGLRGRRAHRGIAVRAGGARGAVRHGHGRRRRRDPVTAKIGPRGAGEGLRACVPSHESRASRATGGVWGRAWMPSDVCARRSCATSAPEAEIARVGFAMHQTLCGVTPPLLSSHFA
jgi:hypothetical protein